MQINKVLNDIKNKSVIFNAQNLEVKSNINEKQEKKRTIELRVELDSWSPIYSEQGLKYREKIDKGAFFTKHKDLQDLSVNSYLDHKISIEHLLASTKNKTMHLKWENEHEKKTILAYLEVDENNQLLKKSADLIEQGVITTNSFIFKVNDLEIKDYDNNKELDFEVIYKDADLISIDPVYQGFYTQDTCRVLNREMKIENSLLSYNLDIKKNNLKEKKIMQEDVVLNNKLNEAKQEAQAQEKRAEIKENNAVQEAKKVEVVIERDNKLLEAQNKTNELLKDLILRNSPKLDNSKTNINFKDVRHKFLNRKALSEDELLVMKSEMKSRIKDWSEVEAVLGYNQAELLKRSLDGTSNEKGLALIESVGLSGILDEFNKVFPEFSEYAQVVPLTGLDNVYKSILIADATIGSAIAENAESTLLNNKVSKVLFKPDRYSTKFSQNNALSRGAELWEAQTQNAKNSIIKGLRKAFYTNLLANVGTNLDVNNYQGGATLEAVKVSAEKGKISFLDLDNIYKELVVEWGDEVANKYIILMHKDTLNALEKPFWDTSNNDMFKTLYNAENKTFRGIPIIISNEYTDKEIATGKHPVTFITKSSITAYGLTFAIADDPYTDLSKDQSNRYVKTRGQIKMCDPNINTRVLKIK